MGRRGPVKGTGGRRAGGNKKPGTAAGVVARSSFIADLSALSVEQFEAFAGQFRELVESDGVALALFWDLLNRYRKLQDVLGARESLTFETEAGYCAALPEVTMLNRAVDQLLTFCARFGMTPGDRLRLGQAPPEALRPVDPFDAHLQRVSTIGKNGESSIKPRRR